VRSSISRAPAQVWAPLLLAVFALALPALAGADGGTLRMSDVPVGPYRMAVFSDPTPLRPDSVDISVLILDLDTQSPVWGLEVTVEVSNDTLSFEHRATRAQAEDPERYYAAKFRVPFVGDAQFRIRVRDDSFDEGASFVARVRARGPLDDPRLVTFLLLLPLGALAIVIFRGSGTHKSGPALGLLLLLMSAAAGCRPEAQPLPWSDLAEVVRAEDLRAAEPPQALIDGLSHDDTRMRAAAVRALGRHERADWLEFVERGLRDTSPDVRVAAADAVAQTGVGGGVPSPALDLLTESIGYERHPMVRSAIAHSAGRLGLDPELADGVEAILLEVSTEPGEPSLFDPRSLSEPGASLLDLIRGALDLARASGGTHPATTDMTALIADITRFGRNTDTELLAENPQGPSLAMSRIRRAATAVLILRGLADGDIVAASARDPDLGVRAQLAQAGANGLLTLPSPILNGFLSDPAPLVRLYALQAHRAQSSDCRPIIDALGDLVPMVRLTAIDLLGAPCSDEDTRQAALAGTVADSVEADTWHGPAHAVVAMSRAGDPDATAAATWLAGHANPFARSWSARALGALGDTEALRALMRDPDANVRTAALRELVPLDREAARTAAAAQLSSADPMLVMTAAAALEGAPRSTDLVDALLDALSRFTALGKETDRDARMALFERIKGLGTPALAPRLTSYLEDYDPVVAEFVASLLNTWGDEVRATPRPFDPEPSPSAEELERLARTTVVFEMERSGEFRLGLWPDVAPTNAARLGRLAASGALDGLTFHRIEPGFVVQGPSPGANEYAGHGAYSRDEVSAQGQWRGTVGISTRGRDTGDGQLFVNLSDNLRLDHEYTLIGEVVEGMDVVERIQEGERIVAVRVTDQPAVPSRRR